MPAAIRFDQGLQSAWNDIARIAPRVLAFLAILVVGIAAARLFAVVVERVLNRAGFNRAVERGGINRALARSRYDATQLLTQITFYGLCLLVLQLAFGVFGRNAVSNLLDSAVGYLPKLFVAIVIIVVASAIAAAVRDIVGSALSATSYGGTVATIAAGTIVMLGVLASLEQLEIAPAIVLGLFYAMLAIVAGSAIVAIGGGGIQPMRTRWERALSRIESEAPAVRAGAREAMAERRVDLVAHEERARWEAEQASAERTSEPARMGPSMAADAPMEASTRRPGDAGEE